MRTDLPVALPFRRDVDLQSLLSVLVPISASGDRRDGMDAGHPN
ncbi:MAG TPA: hypothetical protein VHV28_10170 [Solirubrobacteraceae bacterium]|nr:hypothetical protein [Solirubrobacteraceae bacterium]